MFNHSNLINFKSLIKDPNERPNGLQLIVGFFTILNK